MPPFQKRVFWAAIGASLVNFAVVIVFQPSAGLVYSVIGCGYAGVLLWVLGRGALFHWQIRRFIRGLRRFDTPERAKILSGLDNEAAQAYLERKVAEHGEPEVVGLVERFTFSPVDRRESNLLMWGSALAAGAVLMPAIALPVGNVTRAISIACATALIGTGVTIRNRAPRFLRAYEISPFGLAEVAADGGVRRLSWGYGLTLRNRPWLRRIELAPAGSSECIDIPYSVVGFERLVELILTKGGFSSEAT
jgi:hypothetical protein